MAHNPGRHSMEQSDEKPIPHLLELNDEIETNSDKWSSESIHRTQQSLSFIITRLNRVNNSRLAINRLSPDILYSVFMSAIYPWEKYVPAFHTLSSSQITTLTISSVCHHWRESVLQWPVLWAVIDLDKPPAMTDLFVQRSLNAPLTLSWTTPRDRSASFDKARSKSYFVSHASSILPRLCSLNISTTYSNFIALHQVIWDSKLPLIRPRHVNIELFRIDGDRAVPPPLTHLLVSSLREIELHGLDLRTLELPNNKLTHLTLKGPFKLPFLPRFTIFLSNCPFLEELKLSISDDIHYGAKTPFPSLMPTGPHAINRIDFPNLTGLRLVADGPSSYNYISQLASCIHTLGALSEFMLYCDLRIDYTWPPSHSHPNQLITPFRILNAIPPGVSPHLSKYQYIDITPSHQRNLGIYGYTSASDLHDCPLKIHCRDLELPINYSFVLEFIYIIPQIRHLTLRGQAWKIFTLPNFDTGRAFPCFYTLALTDCDTEALKSLPADLHIKKLILPASCIVSSDVLFDAVVSTGAEVLELTRSCTDVNDMSALGERRVDVVLRTT